MPYKQNPFTNKLDFFEAAIAPTVPLPPNQGGTGTTTVFTQGSVVFAGPLGVYTQDNANFSFNDTTNVLNLSSLVLVTPLAASSGGTGIANAATETITLGGAIVTEGKWNLLGAFDSTFRMTALTDVTFPVSGTLATTAGSVASITGTSQQILANATFATPQTGAVTLTLPILVATEAFEASASPGGNYGAFINDPDTSPTASTPSFFVRNANSTTNCWMRMGFQTRNGNLGALIGAQVTNQSTNLVDLVLFGRNSSTGVTEGARLVGSTNTLTLANPLPVASGGTGQTTYTNGQLLIGNTTGNTLTKATITAGTGMTITNGPGSITIAQTAGSNVTSITGTANQVIASASTGAVTLSLPQSIATTSNVTFGSATLSTAAQNVTSLSNNTSSTSATTTSTTNGNIAMINLSNTNNNWQTISHADSGGNLSGISGFQVTNHSTSAGDFVWFTGTGGSPTERMRFTSTGFLGIGAGPGGFLDVQGSNSVNGALYCTLLRTNLTETGSGSGTSALFVGGTHTINGSGTNSANYIQVVPVVVATTAISSIAGYQGFGPSISGAAVTTNCYTMNLMGASSVGAGGLTNAYTASFSAPTVGTTKTSLYTDNLSIGYTAITPPTLGAIVSGFAGFGTSSPDSGVHINRTSASAADPKLLITQEGGAGSDLFGIAIYEKNGVGDVYLDNLYDLATVNTFFRGRTTGTPVSTFGIRNDGIITIGATSSNQHVLNTLTSATATGGAATIPVLAQGFITITINGTARKIPYFAT